ncbi:MAG TPA: division/cell wall cluster transcriptional repressor MraZ [Casimicrobium huifangae]|jgi:MraZ protein|uniref:division/cell wall cluster transcriptional repressor MraZ n=1 Tax=Casimicrobium huifangae TaxID=2591109 RepID=UPI0012EC2515|nr:division/cell wall cluster transcriptional repressor MraZ [Casimicrobium huifangae]HOB00674.1 division/cell wall cluster transcriptional repressor MraZ [Casimicrobium huifangae]HQA34174.1 division/cell wall cluster transcriptional repressor MraZ [Casimicrobium huifangae]HQD65287.1 division/cell wall cluster transcriptional repressor MraZ [Casimicrobium huifangae]
MFTGASNLSIDAKGRMAIPTRYRDALGVNLVLTADPSGCLLLFAADAWQPFEARVSALPNMNPRIKAMQRMWLGYKSDCEVDGAGRVVLTPEMRDYAKLDRKVQMIGQGDRFELWSERGWQDVIELAQRAMREDPPAELAGLSV